MAKADQQDVDEVQRLQTILRQRHEALAEARADGGSDNDALGPLFAATKSLLEFEAQIPARRDERRRRISSVIVWATAGLAVLIMLVELALMTFGEISWWYLPAAVPVGATAAGLALAEEKAQTRGHRRRAVAAVLVLVGAALVAVVTGRLLSAFTLFLVLAVLVAAWACWLFAGDEPGEKP
jgi:peptidoglycan/LPS O-acetylase OafA/YrhL